MKAILSCISRVSTAGSRSPLMLAYRSARTRRVLDTGFVGRAWRYVAVGLVITVSTLAIDMISKIIDVPNISLLYLPPILVAAIYFGTVCGLAASALAVVQYDFFLLTPRFTLTVNRLEDGVALVVFSIVAVVTSQLAAGARARAEAAAAHARESETLHHLSEAVMSAEGVSDILRLIARLVTSTFPAWHCAIYLPVAEGPLILAATSDPTCPVERKQAAAAQYVFRQGDEVSIPVQETESAPQSFSRFYPLRTADRVQGVMQISWKEANPLSTPGVSSSAELFESGGPHHRTDKDRGGAAAHSHIGGC